MASPPVLTRRQPNRSLLARQMLLGRVDLPAIEVVERLVGMQAQVPTDPYTALWSRIQGFQPAELSKLIAERRAVRAVGLMRTTIHLVSARDALTIRPLMQPVLDRAWRYSPWMRGSILVDGFVRGTWRMDSKRGESTLTIGLFDSLTPSDRADVAAKAELLADFLMPDVRTRDIRTGELG